MAWLHLYRGSVVLLDLGLPKATVEERLYPGSRNRVVVVSAIWIFFWMERYNVRKARSGRVIPMAIDEPCAKISSKLPLGESDLVLENTATHSLF